MSVVRGKDSETVLQEIAKMLEEGLETQTEPFPDSSVEFAKVLDELRALDPDDLKGKLQIAGFTDHPYGPDEMRCQECIYFLVHRKWCDLPELSLPVEADWWCKPGKRKNGKKLKMGKELF